MHAIQLAKKWEKAATVTRYYNKAIQAGILTYFRLVADATNLPMILYNIDPEEPAVALIGTEITWATAVDLPKVAGPLAGPRGTANHMSAYRPIN